MKRGPESSEPTDEQSIELPSKERLKKAVDVLASLCSKDTVRIEPANEVLPRPWPRFSRG